MKKQYLSPQLKVVCVDCTSILSASIEKVTVSKFIYEEEDDYWE